MSENMIPLFVAIPMGMAFLIPMVSRKLKWAPDVFGNLTMLCLVIMSVAALGQTSPVIYSMGGWKTPLGIDLRLDGLSALMLITINVIGLAATTADGTPCALSASWTAWASLFGVTWINKV